MTVWFWSDPHFGHKNILAYEKRPFVSTQEMDECLIRIYNLQVKPGDVVFWLGDIFFCNAERMRWIVSQMDLTRARNILIRGNHDRGISNGKFRKLGFWPVYYYLYESLLLSHYPLSSTLLEQASWAEGKILYNVHGHTHGQETGLDPARWQCVSVEKTNYQLLSYEDVIHRLKG